MIDAGESEDNIATVIQHFKAQPPAQPQVRSRTGQLYTPPQESGGKEFLEGAAQAVNPMNLVRLAQRAYEDPKGTAANIALLPLRLVGRLVTNPAETLGGLTAGVGVNAGL